MAPAAVHLPPLRQAAFVSGFPYGFLPLPIRLGGGTCALSSAKRISEGRATVPDCSPRRHRAALRHPYYKTRDNSTISNTISKALSYRLQDTIDMLKKTKINYLEPGKLEKNATEEQIIERLSGDDKTKGSCSSLAFAYAGNKAGFDVLDFRDGESRSFFSSGLNINNIISNAGGKIESSVNDFKSAKICLETTEKGKEYYFACGKHAAIVRKIDEGKYEYLELQSKKFKGWHTLTEYELKRRFGAKSSHSLYGHKYEAKSFIINIELLQNCSDFKEVLGYIYMRKQTK